MKQALLAALFLAVVSDAGTAMSGTPRTTESPLETRFTVAFLVKL